MSVNISACTHIGTLFEINDFSENVVRSSAPCCLSSLTTTCSYPCAGPLRSPTTNVSELWSRGPRCLSPLDPDPPGRVQSVQRHRPHVPTQVARPPTAPTQVRD